MESNALEKSTSYSVALRFFARTPRNRQMVKINDDVDWFLPKPFWFVLSIFSILGCMWMHSRALYILAAMEVRLYLGCSWLYRGHPFLGKGRMESFAHLSILFLLDMALQFRSSMSSDSLVFHTSGGISSSLAAFLFLIFLCTKLSYSCINWPSLMSNCLLIIFVIGSWVIFRGFPSKFSKCCFHRCIRSSWLVAFSLAFAVLFLLLTLFTVCYAILDCLSLTESLILLIWFCMYSVGSFR